MKNRKPFQILFICLVICLGCMVLFKCTPSVTPVSGGASDTEVSASISGTVSDSVGNTIAGARINLRLEDYLPEARLLKNMMTLRTQADAVSDENGFFFIDSIEKGTYVLSINSGDTFGITNTCVIYSSDDLDLKPVIKPMGMIMGQVSFFYYMPEFMKNTKIEILGSEESARPDTMGFFQIQLPEGKHRLRVSVDSSLFDEMVIDVEVLSSRMKNVGILHLNYLPPPCFGHNCDSFALRGFLDSAGYPEIPVDSVAEWRFNRIIKLNLRDIPLSTSLFVLGQLTGLEEIDLGNTGTADSCRFLWGMWNLKVLRLDSNNITGLSTSISSPHHLLELDISDNKLTSLPQNIVTLTPSEGLDITGNALCNLSPMIGGWADMWSDGWREQQNCGP